MRGRWKPRWRWAALGAVVSSVVALSVAGVPAGAATPGSQPAGPVGTATGAAALLAAGTPVAASTAGSTGPSQTVTLITGDVIRVAGQPGKQSAQVIKSAGSASSLSTVEFRRQGDLYVIPGAAVPLIAAGKLDESLFDVSELLRDGYTGSTLPVLVTYTTGSQAVRAQSTRQLAATATAGTYLWSIQGVATQVNLKQGPSFFNSITVPAATAPAGGSSPALVPGSLAIKPGVAKVWLDAKVRATAVDVSRTAIGADTAWAAGYQGATAKVAILDTGIDATHPDLAGQIAAEQNFVPAGNPGGGDPTDVTDRVGHGTHVAGIIAGTGAASGGLYSGVAPKAQLVIGKVLDDQGSGEDSWIIAGMQWAAGQAKIINMSLGGDISDGTDPLSQALDTIASSTGALFVVAAGNDGLSADGNPNGGPGSCAQCIESPGSATAALTVGAIDDGCAFPDGDPNDCPGRSYSDDNIAWFSSTGPRPGDFAIKPEITAPGVDIPSAEASGIPPLGTPVAAYPSQYMYLSGTSMATPMVAGSAAILLGEHPDWTAQQIRDALTSTATPNASEPAYWQGAGMVNVGKAATQAVTGTGILNLGAAAYPQQPGSMLTGDITYTNTGSQPQTLTLSSSFATAPQDFGFRESQAPWSPPAGAVSLPGQVTVPAGGSQTVQLGIDASQAPDFTTYGQVTATAADGTTVRTTVGFTRAVETHQLSLTAIDRTGAPETTNGYSFGYLMDLTDGQLYYVSFSNGTGTIQGTLDNQLIAGRSYAFLGQIASFGPDPYDRLQSWTQVAEPQITMNANQSFTFDARKAGLVRVDTQRPAIGMENCSAISRGDPAGAFLQFTDCGGLATPQDSDLYTLAGGQATTGTFQFQLYTHREQAPVAITASGLSTALLPRYPSIAATDGDPGDSQLATDSQPRFPAAAGLRVADVGSGTPAEIAAAHVAGKIALLHPPITSPITGTVGIAFTMQLDGATAKAIASAGAAGILVAPPADGINLISYNQSDLPSIPTALLSYQEAAQLAGLLTASRGHVANVTVASAFPSSYSYDLVLTQPGTGLTNGVTFRVQDGDLARVTTRYKAAAAGQYYSAVTEAPSGFGDSPGYAEDFPARVVRTEMYTPGALFLQNRDTVEDSQGLVDEQDDFSLPAAGQYQMNVGSGPWVPTLEIASRGSDLSLTSGAAYTGSAGNETLFQEFGVTSPNTSTIVCQPPACTQDQFGNDVLSGDGHYQVINDQSQTPLPGSGVTGSNPLSATTHTVWTIDVHLNTQSTTSITQPMILTTWYVNGGLDNVVPSHAPYTVQVVPSYLAGTGHHGLVTARLMATYDDGKTWVAVPGTQVVRAGQPATFTVRTPARTNGFVGYRVQMSDADGNAIDQTVMRAAYTQPPAPSNSAKK
ncbi:MAG TPA: S8 family serine peptidase [Trebonia sp.]|nr:S8 family serine peptidase [Trebonia sp.]